MRHIDYITKAAVVIKLSFATTLIWMFSQASFGGIYCGNHIIQEGDMKLKVLAACGPPNLLNPQPFSVFGNEVWQYNYGPDRFMRSIKFRNGEVIIIKDHPDYGL